MTQAVPRGGELSKPASVTSTTKPQRQPYFTPLQWAEHRLFLSVMGLVFALGSPIRDHQPAEGILVLLTGVFFITGVVPFIKFCLRRIRR